MSSPTLGDLIDRTLDDLHGYTADLEEMTSLVNPIGTTDTSFVVDDATQVTLGLIEIDSELMWVKKVDTSINTIYIAAFGRGFRQTAPAAHSANAMIINNPRFPRQAVSNALAITLLAVYPDLFVIKTDETQVSNPVVVTYQVPADCDLVLDLQWQMIGASKTWERVRGWRFDPKADTTAFTTGKSVDILDAMSPGRTIKMTYIAQPTAFASESSAISTTGLQDSVADVLIYGACYRLLASLEASRLQTQSIEQSERSQLVQPGAASSASKYYFGLYAQALQREIERLQKFYPTHSHQVR